jgi:hypothetical protein
LAWDCGAGCYFEFLIRRHFVLNIFPFLVGKAKLTGEFFNNRRSAANSYPLFAYSLVSLMLRQYYWFCDSYSANRRSEFKKIRGNSLLVLQIRPALPKGAANVPRFANKCQMSRSAINKSCAIYIAQIVLALSRSYRFTYFSRTRL